MRNRKDNLGFTLLELQVALVLLTMGMMTLASLLATQARTEKRIARGFTPDSTIHLTRSNDPWVRKLGVPARISVEELSLTAPTAVTATNNVAIVGQSNNLEAETMTVTVDVTPTVP
jgi:hypothetical protein